MTDEQDEAGRTIRDPADGEANGRGAASGDGASASAEERIAALEAELRAKAEEALRNHDRYLREAADADNFRKRLQRDKADAVRYANEAILRDLLPIIDSLELAVAHAEPAGREQSVVQGVELTLRLFRDLLERHGVKEIPDPAGMPFDPALHEAGEVEAADFPANTVLRQRTKGYRYHDRLLRPARVVVARPVIPPEPGPSQTSH
jgi:molecular chaperone GrpE